MIDLHCHILPGIDDGAPDIHESMALIKAAIANGITHMVCTPHIQLGRFDNTLESITAVFEQVVTEVEKHSLPISLSYGSEVRICPEIMVMHEQQQLPFIGQWQGSNVLLLELPHSHIPPGTEQLIKWLFNHGITPMIAHPERNRGILANYSNIKPLLRQHCLLQVTAASVCGDFGSAIQLLAEKLLKAELVTVIATDAHRMKRRPPILAQGYKAAATIIGEEKAVRLVKSNPEQIVAAK